MGRFTAYDQNGRMVADFDKSGYDLMRMRQGYEDEIERLMVENVKLRELCCEMLKEHQRIYHAGGTLKMGPSATNKQMAHWYSECMRWGVGVDG